MLLDETDNCPVAEQCESCGSTLDLDVATADLPVGVFCVTLCENCAVTQLLPKIRNWSIAYDRVCDHCIHLGIDMDEMARLIEAERSR